MGADVDDAGDGAAGQLDHREARLVAGRVEGAVGRLGTDAERDLAGEVERVEADDRHVARGRPRQQVGQPLHECGRVAVQPFGRGRAVQREQAPGRLGHGRDLVGHQVVLGGQPAERAQRALACGELVGDAGALAGEDLLCAVGVGGQQLVDRRQRHVERAQQRDRERGAQLAGVVVAVAGVGIDPGGESRPSAS